ncbi:hypothetical protein [Prochlorococcus sp. MIT 0701]|uniref:hypothetical protein n=1 Tax=Prochlorococcus sp. MIT 0701 TaxID=1499502 RepID=UPI00056AAFEA|nr:hypothetical protein [Prochlorococcus sp. MIT 0701]
MSSAESSKISAKAKNIVKLYFTSVIASFALFLVAVYLNPSNTDFIHKEDGLLENLSAGICFATFIFGIVLILRNCRYKKMLAGISFVSLLGFLDKISFGGRIFKIKYPRIFGVNIDGIHDFLSVAKRLVKNEIIEMPGRHLTAIFITAIILSLIAWTLYSLILRSTILFNSPYLILFTAFAIFVVISQLIDLELLFNDHNVYLITIEELFEAFAALSLLFVCLLVKTERVSGNVLK